MKKVALVKDRNRFWEIYQKELLNYGVSVDLIEIWDQAEQNRLLTGSYDAFIWRAKHNPKIKNLAKRFLYLFDQQFNIPAFPDWNSYWHFDDKIAQAYLMEKSKIPGAKTWVFYDKEQALEFVAQNEYPLIYKCAHGAGSANVGLLKDVRAAKRYIKKVFDKGVPTFFKSEVQKGYAYLQEFLPDNNGDYRLVCWGDQKVQGFFRQNRPDSVFASGSGKFDIPELPADLLDFVSGINQKLNYPVMSYDVLKNKDGHWIITELSVIFGDLTHKIYDQVPVYERLNGNWMKHETLEPIPEQTIKYLVHDVWGWF